MSVTIQMNTAPDITQFSSYVPFITLHKAVLNSNSVDLILPMAMVRPSK